MRQNTQVPFDYKPKSTAVAAPRWLLAVMMFPLLGGVLAYVLVDQGPRESDEASTATANSASDAQTSEQDRFQKIDFVVRRNDTLERIFRELKLRIEDMSAILGLPGARQALTQLRPGDKVSLVHHDGMLQALKRRISETEVLSVTRGDNGFAAHIVATPIEVKTARTQGTIQSSLFVAARAAGLSPESIMQLANDIFGWEIDFALDIRPGDRFNVAYEQKYRDGQYIGPGRIVAAEFVTEGEMHRAVYYASADGKIDGYFTPDGGSMRRQFLRAPLDFRRVSSNFNPARRHPILNRIRAHQGVDYSAPIGTIIKAAGDGRVGFVGVRGGYGNVVVLEHGGGVSTLYGHMSRFAKGLRRGERVNQGETIGFVGHSGAATGPHLHYEYRVNGVHKNPRTVHLPNAAPIPDEYLADFRAHADMLFAELAPQDTTVAAGPSD